MSQTDSLFVELMKTWIGHILLCKQKDGHEFKAKLVGVRGKQLMFQCKNGRVEMDNLDDLAAANIFEPEKSTKRNVCVSCGLGFREFEEPVETAEGKMHYECASPREGEDAKSRPMYGIT